jgi:hypothetical protein
MTHLTHPYARAFALALVAGASCWSTASLAQTAQASTTAEPDPSASGDVIRLTDAQRREILDNNTAESAAAARGERPGLGSGLAGSGIHGEVGAMIGSHGSRGIYGTADIPLGDNAGATVSFESSRFGYPR